ncbi:unnamed protein product [Effrenium voratum]|nr:unnamed protein product [Effrenium voratum]
MRKVLADPSRRLWQARTCTSNPLQTFGEDRLLRDWHASVRIFRLAQAFRHRGHLAACLDPLRGKQSRKLSPDEPVHWRVGGRHGQKIHSIDVNQLLREYPERIDLGVFALEDFAETDPLPAGVEVPAFWGEAPSGVWTFRSLVDRLHSAYASTFSMEHQHIDNPSERWWLEERVESRGPCPASAGARNAAFHRLLRADTLEVFLGTKFPKAKRFGLKGCEALLPALWSLTEKASELGMEHLQLGMAHRGRLNVLVNFLGKRVWEVCSEFGEQNDFLGDLKYHLGTRGACTVGSKDVHFTLAPNPSHLEAVDPVVLGMTRAKQDYMGDQDMLRVMGVLIHGDAAFCGQGIISECLQLADLPAYTTGGTVHFIINNMVGFTTDPRAARSSYHCTNVAKVNDAPIFHVNADDVDAVIFAAKLAAEYRQVFRKDVVVDLVCYRREGHSEVDDASLTQPLTQERMDRHPPVAQQYCAVLVEAGIVKKEDVEAEVDQIFEELEAEHRYSQLGVGLQDWKIHDAQTRPVNLTGLPLSWLTQIGEATCRIPEHVKAHPTVCKLFQARRLQLRTGRVDWALAETLAIGSLTLRFDPKRHEAPNTGLLTEEELHYVVHPPCHVRLSGQDVERGTFNQRHSIIYDQNSATPHSMLSDLGLGEQSEAVICNSSLSELAILGYEYGYSLEEGAGLALTMWEAQFGDFANCAQPIIDNFIASGEQKWGNLSNLVMLLPHGLEGQGPEHSSARPERFLQLVDEDPEMLWPAPDKALEEKKKQEAKAAVQRVLDAIRSGEAREREQSVHSLALLQESFDFCRNIMIAYVTTPANLFHVLRRQVHRSFAKPLILMTGKYLLHHRPCRSPLEHMVSGTRFQRLIQEGSSGDNMSTSVSTKRCRRLIFCSGKVFYDLHHARAARCLEGTVMLHRLEQVAPFPAMSVAVVCSQYPDAELYWVQEEPKNMGPWSYVAPRFATALRELSPDAKERPLRCVARPAAASPATPLFKMHRQEVRLLLAEALCIE